MNRINLCLCGLLACLALEIHSQDMTSINGYVTDGTSGERLISATIYAPELSLGTTTNEYGFYSLDIPYGKETTLIYSYIGLSSVDTLVTGLSSARLDIELGAGGIQVDEIVVTANSYEERLRSTEMSVEEISIKEVQSLPAILGEVDLIKVIQLKPGISSGSEGSSSLFVRGGAGDQNLILLDEAIVYNANHLFGFFSTFNSDGIKDAKVLKGGFPAQYGGRLSSVIDVRLKEGNKKKFSGAGGIGILSTRLTLEGPIVEDKVSFMVSGRRTYVDLITEQINRQNRNTEDYDPIPAYSFYDLNTKVNVKLDDKNHLYLSGYFGRDVFAFEDEDFDFNFNWGNATGTLRWNHQFNSKLFSNTTLTFSDYQYNINNDLTGFSFMLSSKIQDFSLKQDFFYALSNKHTLRAGGQVTDHKFELGRFNFSSDEDDISFSSGEERSGLEFGVYISDEYTASDRLNLNYGLRLSGFNSESKTYFNLEPRFAANYILSPKVSLKASYARMNQYVHLIANSGLSLPTDLWYPSTERVKPQRSDQVALGYKWQLRPQYLFTNEYFYKKMDNQIEFVDHAQLFANPNIEEEFVYGKGRAYGSEFSIEKQSGRLTGWIGYTLQRVERGDFPEILDGAYFSPRYDRRHDVSTALIYKLSEKWSLSAAFVFGSGDVSWLPSSKFLFQDIDEASFQGVVPIYEDRNNFRLAPYHRLDLGATKKLKTKNENFHSELAFSIINAYNRRNPYFVYLDVETVDAELLGNQTTEIPVRITAKQVSLFPLLPSITWNFKF